MKRYLIVILLSFNFSNAQEIFKDQQLGFEMKKPEGWIKAKKNEAVENLKEQIKLPENQLKQMIQNNKGTIEVVSFFKHDIHSTLGIIPTVKVNLRNNPVKSIEAFKKMIEASYGKLKEIFPDFTFITKPSIIKINGRNCIFSVSTYTVKSKSSSEKVRNYVYAIPVDDTFYQIALMDTEKEDCKIEFEKVAKSIHID